ncbi:MAG: virulence factor SrfB, partial [Bacteroidota bacterium]
SGRSFGNGVIEKYARQLGCQQVTEMLNNFFGQDSTRQNYRQRMYRKNFVIQVAVPIAKRYLQHAQDGLEDQELTFSDFFPTVKPNEELLKYINEHFSQYCNEPFVFQDIRWKLSKDRIFRLVEGTFDRLLTQTAMLMSAYGCDFVLLAGKPTTLPVIREMFVKYYPVSPDRIITLNNYRVGHWYPFATDSGFFDDPKSIVATGALIALTAGQTNKLDGFRLDTELLKTQLISTADFIGSFNKNTNDIEQIYLSPEKNLTNIVFNGSPMALGFKQIANRECDGRPMYKLQLSRQWLLERARSNGLTGNEEAMAIEKEQVKMMNRVPLTVTVERIFDESKEEIRIVEIEDKDDNPVSNGVLELLKCTLPDERGYWLDTGEFTLNIGKTTIAE